MVIQRVHGKDRERQGGLGELQKQLDAMGLQVKRGTIQDATFIEADVGLSKKPRGEDTKARRSKDGTWAKKDDETHFGFNKDNASKAPEALFQSAKLMLQSTRSIYLPRRSYAQ